MVANRFELKVLRFDPFRDAKPYHKLYEIHSDGPLSLLMALEYIYESLDDTLAFRRYCCGTSRCNSCLMQVNGKKVRACSMLVEEGKELRVEPLEGYRVIKDLVVDFGDEKEES